MSRVLALFALCWTLGCGPGPALKNYVKDKGLLRGSRVLTVIGFQEDSFTLANDLRRKGFTVTFANNKLDVTSGLLLEIAGCCPNGWSYGYCPSLGVEIFSIDKGVKIFGAVIDDSRECPNRFYAAVAEELASRWDR
jgi:hypothetical protein